MLSSLFGPAREPSPAEKEQAVGALRDKFAGSFLTQGEPALWLQSTKWDLKKAEKRLAAHVKWRKKHVPSGLIQKAEIQGQLAAEKTFLQGSDRNGRPVLVVLGSRHLKTDTEDLRRMMIYAIEGSIAAIDEARNPRGDYVMIFDLRGLRYENLDVHGMIMVFGLLSEEYPERLHQMVMLGAPSIFWGMWKAVVPFLGADMRARVHFVSEAEAPAYLSAFIPPEVLPETMGGKAPLRPVADVVEAQRAQQPAGPQQSA